jgi:ribonucleoside-diphosphate reductase alpha chain
VTLKATSFYVIEAVQQMLSAVGIRSYYTVNKPKDVEFENGTYTCKQSYDLNITVDRGRFAHMIGFIQPEKTLRLAEACKMVSNKPPKTSYEVVEIEYLGDFPVWDITVKAEEHTYWTGGLLVSNCGEFAFLDDSACNLASLNLMRFRFPDGKLDIDALRHATRVFIMAQEILVDRADYPTPTIKKNSMRYRPLGLGYANLGAYLMSIGLPYDSDDARHIAAEVTSIITAEAYLTSTKLATAKQPFEAYTPNRAAMLHVMQQHLAAAGERDLASTSVWEQVIDQGERWGFRNAQVTLCAPTGTISFMMDCDTTGIEPEMSLYKVKSLVGGGTVVMENRIVEMALEKLTYQSQSRKDILRYLARHKHLDGCPQLLKEHLAVFDCAIPAAGTRVLSPQAHIKMVAAIQPFISGAISKTVNLPHSTTPEQIGEIYVESWKLGIKHVTVYRDNCKKSQPLITAVDVLKDEERPTAVRNKLADHQTNMHRIKFRFNAVKGYILVTPYEDTGMPGEIFVRLSKEGSTIQGLVDGWAQSISYCLQFGVPLEVLVQKFSHTKFEPSGYSGDPDIKFAHSIYDAIVRKLAAVFLKQPMTNGHTPEDDDFASHDDIESAIRDKMSDYDSPPCNDCGAIMQRNGSCYVCPTCGITSGCS